MKALMIVIFAVLLAPLPAKLGKSCQSIAGMPSTCDTLTCEYEWQADGDPTLEGWYLVRDDCGQGWGCYCPDEPPIDGVFGEFVTFECKQ